MAWPPPSPPLRPYPVTSIADFGAKPDDEKTDNSLFIQQAINVVRAQDGGIVYIPPGRFYCQTPIDLDFASGVTLMGCAPGGQNGSALHFVKASNQAQFTAPILIRLHSVRSLSIRDLSFIIETDVFTNWHGARQAVEFEGTLLDFDQACAEADSECRDVVISACLFQQMTPTMDDGTNYFGFKANFIRLGAGASRVSISRAIFSGGRNGIVGDGAGDVLVQECAFNQGGPNCGVRLRDRCDHWMITSCGFDPSGGSHGEKDKPTFYSSNNWQRAVWCVDDRIGMNGDEVGKDLDPAQACRGLVISNCEFADSGGFQKDVLRLVVQGCVVTGNTLSQPFYDAMVALGSGSGGVFVAGNVISGRTTVTTPPKPVLTEVGVRLSPDVEGVVIVSNHPLPPPAALLHCEPMGTRNLVVLANAMGNQAANVKLD